MSIALLLYHWLVIVGEESNKWNFSIRNPDMHICGKASTKKILLIQESIKISVERSKEHISWTIRNM